MVEIDVRLDGTEVLVAIEVAVAADVVVDGAAIVVVIFISSHVIIADEVFRWEGDTGEWLGCVLAVAAGEAGGELTGVVLSDTLVVKAKESIVAAAEIVFVLEIVLEDLALGLPVGTIDVPDVTVVVIAGVVLLLLLMTLPLVPLDASSVFIDAIIKIILHQ